MGIVIFVASVGIGAGRAQWWWSIVIAVAASLFTLVVVGQNRAAIGLGGVTGRGVALNVTAMMVCGVAGYWTGRGARRLIDRARSSSRGDDYEKQCILELREVWITYQRARPTYLAGSLTEQLETAALAFLPGIREKFPVFRKAPEAKLWSLFLTAVMLAHTHAEEEIRAAVEDLKRRHFLTANDPPLLR